MDELLPNTASLRNTYCYSGPGLIPPRSLLSQRFHRLKWPVVLHVSTLGNPICYTRILSSDIIESYCEIHAIKKLVKGGRLRTLLAYQQQQVYQKIAVGREGGCSEARKNQVYSVKIICTKRYHSNYVPVVVAFAAEVAAAALELVGNAVVLDAPPVPVPATVACTICPKELKMILTNALSGEYEYCFCTLPPESGVETPV
jgi:hypothetical protein